MSTGIEYLEDGEVSPTSPTSPMRPLKTPSPPSISPLSSLIAQAKAQAKSPSKAPSSSHSKTRNSPSKRNRPPRQSPRRTSPSATRSQHQPLAKTTQPVINKSLRPRPKYARDYKVSDKMRKSLECPGWRLKGYLARKRLHDWEKEVGREVEKRVEEAVQELKDKKGDQIGELLGKMIQAEIEREVRERVDRDADKTSRLLNKRYQELLVESNRLLEKHQQLVFRLEDLYYGHYGNGSRRQQISEAYLIEAIEYMVSVEEV